MCLDVGFGTVEIPQKKKKKSKTEQPDWCGSTNQSPVGSRHRLPLVPAGSYRFLTAETTEPGVFVDLIICAAESIGR